MTAAEFAAELNRYSFFDERITLQTKLVSGEGHADEVRVTISVGVFKNIAWRPGLENISTVCICEVVTPPFDVTRARCVVRGLWNQFMAHEYGEQIRLDGKRIYHPHDERPGTNADG